MPDPITSLSQVQKSVSQLQRTQGAIANGDAQEALKGLQEMMGNNGAGAAATNGTPGLDSLLKNPSLSGLLNDPKVKEALGTLQKGVNNPAAVQGVAAAEDPKTAGNRTLTEDATLNTSEGLGMAPLSGGSVAPAFGEVVQGFLQHVNNSQEKSAEMIESLALGENIDVHQVMLALNEASNAMGLTLQVRSHALKAYQDLMQLPL